MALNYDLLVPCWEMVVFVFLGCMFARLSFVLLASVFLLQKVYFFLNGGILMVVLLF